MFEVRRLLFALRGGLVAFCIALTASCGGGGGSGASSGGGGTTDPPPSGGSSVTTPSAPTALQATSGNAQISLSWSASTGASSYNVKRSTTNGGPYTQLQSPTSASYSDTGLTNGTTYYYVVSAVNSGGESANSAQVSGTPAAPAPPTSAPPAPTGVTATAGDAQITISWSAIAGTLYYNLRRSTTSGGPYTPIKSPTTNTYVDTSLTNGITYYYTVTAVNSVGEGAASAEVSAIPVLTGSSPPPTTFGTWINVTPSNVDLNNDLPCQNYGVESVQVDPADGHTLYAQFHCQGIWKSTDFGATWTGPINTGTNGAVAGDCAGGITIPPTSASSGGPTIYEACIRGNGLGFWKSTDGGVSWTNYFVAPAGASRQDYYPPVVDPYDETHLVMAGHEMNYLVQSTDGGQTWTALNMDSGMMQSGGTAEVFFINTGSASSTRGTLLWIGQGGAGKGTWRTANSGTTWIQVDKNEHPHGAGQIYQPDTNGTVYMAGFHSALGDGVLRSADYGQTWNHVGNGVNQTVVWGTSKNVYSMFGWSIGAGQTMDVAFQVASQVGTGTWVKPGTPAGLTQGTHEVRVISDGTHTIMVGAMGNVGLWRYIEP